MKNFDHALILREDDPVAARNSCRIRTAGYKGRRAAEYFDGRTVRCELATAYPECRLVVTKETLTVEGMIKIAYALLKDKLNIVKLTFTSGDNAATQDFKAEGTMDRCPLCGVAMDENGVCPKCGYRKK